MAPSPACGTCGPWWRGEGAHGAGAMVPLPRPCRWPYRGPCRVLAEREVLLYCDFHGHSRKNNVFMYGCDGGGAGSAARLRQRVFPLMLSKNAPDKVGHPGSGDTGNAAAVPLPRVPPRCPRGAGGHTPPAALTPAPAQFSFPSCKFKVQKSKVGTGRVVMWRLGVSHSYTMEAAFGGSTLGEGPPRAGLLVLRVGRRCLFCCPLSPQAGGTRTSPCRTSSRWAPTCATPCSTSATPTPPRWAAAVAWAAAARLLPVPSGPW